MPRIQIVTDSAAVIDPRIVKQFDITVLPLTIRIDGKDYEDDADISAEELILGMAGRHLLPRIVGPTVDQFERLYTELTRRTDQIISLHSSASLSLIHRAAQEAARDFMGRCDIVVMDSETLSMGLGILVEEAAKQGKLSLHALPRGVVLLKRSAALKLHHEIHAAGIGLMGQIIAGQDDASCAIGLLYLTEEQIEDIKGSYEGTLRAGTVMGAVSSHWHEHGIDTTLRKAWHEAVTKRGRLALIDPLHKLENVPVSIEDDEVIRRRHGGLPSAG